MSDASESLLYLGADIGGTKTLLGMRQGGGVVDRIQRYDNSRFPDLATVLQDYLAGGTQLEPARTVVTLAIAGPVSGQRCQMTNLPWLIDGSALQREWGFKAVYLLNDLAATAWALPDLYEQEALQLLHGLRLDFTQPVAVISVGTGLGEAVMVPDARLGLTVLGSEGGHKQFAPFNRRSARLLEQAFATGRTGISWENWFSGSGLPQLYRALYPDLEVPANETLSIQAQAHPESPAAQCMAMLADGIFAEAGNLALQTLAWGGVVFAGGVVRHMEHLMKDLRHQHYFSRKSEHVERLQQVPLALCVDSRVALKGALAYGWYQQMRGS